MRSSPSSLLRSFRIFFLLVVATGAAAQQNPVQPRIIQAVDETRLTVLRGNTHPRALARYDQGAAPPSLPMQRMFLVLQRSAAQETALRQLLDEQQDKSSPNYHKWLAPEQFGQQYGPADSDLQAVMSWLQSHGFQISSLSKGRTAIEFSGTAAMVQEAFHTAIHKYLVNSEEHWANASDPQIPSALTPVVAGVWTLHNFLKKPDLVMSKERFPLVDVPGSTKPQITGSNGQHLLGPGDYAVIYGINPVYQAGVVGNNVTIAVVGRSDIQLNDVFTFRSIFSVPGGNLPIIPNGPDPGDLGGAEEAEAVLDTTWSGVVAQGATVDLVVSGSTNTTDGADLSELYIVDNNLGDVMTESFGTCEATATTAQLTGISALAEQAAAQGITYLVSSGDTGSAGCDNLAEITATGPLSVNALASTPFTVAVGGTMFNENGHDSAYWSSTTTAPVTALRYIPENVWNESCTGGKCGSNAGIAAGGGGPSSVVPKPSWQSGVKNIPADGFRDVPDVALTSAIHDPYLLCLAGSCGQGFLVGIAGTSAAAPSFAGIMALIDQKVGGRIGLANYVLYRLAAAETVSQCNASSTSTAPASTCVFNDVTVGNNAVPGEASYGTNAPQFAGTVGYDLATGLGSVQVNNLVNNWSSVTFKASTTTLTLSPLTGITHGTAVTIGITVAPQSGTGTPTGDVSLLANASATSTGG
jgi:subtilase family serine protease